MKKGQHTLDAIHGESIVPYPSGTSPLRLKSPLDSIKHRNKDITLDRAVELNGNKFTACNPSVLVRGVLTECQA